MSRSNQEESSTLQWGRRSKCELAVCCSCTMLVLLFVLTLVQYSNITDKELMLQRPYLKSAAKKHAGSAKVQPEVHPEVEVISARFKLDKTAQHIRTAENNFPTNHHAGIMNRDRELPSHAHHGEEHKILHPLRSLLPIRSDYPGASDVRVSVKPENTKKPIAQSLSTSSGTTEHPVFKKYGILHDPKYYPEQDYMGVVAPPPAAPVVFCHVRQHAAQALAHPLSKTCTHFLIDLNRASARHNVRNIVVPTNVKLVVLTEEKMLMSPVYQEDFKHHIEKFKPFGYSYSGVFFLDPMTNVAGRLRNVCSTAESMGHDVIFLINPAKPIVFTQPHFQKALYYSGKYVVVLNNRANEHIGQRLMCDNPYEFTAQMPKEPPVHTVKHLLNEMHEIVWPNNTYIVPAVSLRVRCFSIRKHLDTPPPEMHPTQPVQSCANTGCPDMFTNETDKNVPVVSTLSDCTMFWRQNGHVFTGIMPGNEKVLHALQQSYPSIALWFWDDWYRCFKVRAHHGLLKADALKPK